MEMKLATDCWLEAEDNIRSIDPKRICSFGVSVLDDAMYGILPNDLVVIGADSGAGKSDLALDIAVHNASNGKKVGLYFIEGGCEEAINRIRWKIIKNRYYRAGHTEIDMDYRKWRMNLLNCPLLGDINMDCYNEFKDKIKNNLHLYSFEEGFTIENLVNSLGWFSVQKPGEFLMETHIEVDLLIVDHLQYFTLQNPKNELTEMTQILMKVKDITNFHKIPVILISHLRKKDKDRGLPSQEDFFGTSNIAKVASQAITIASYYQGDDYTNGIYPTFFRFIKSRTGLRPSLGFLCDYKYKEGKYAENYLPYKLIKDTPSEKPMERHNYPSWVYEGLTKRGLLK
jgi:RecA/RadA recombinase